MTLIYIVLSISILSNINIFSFLKGAYMFIEKIADDNLWNEYLSSKLERDFISDKEKEEIKDFVTNKKYKKIVKEIKNHKYSFSIPNKHLINKNHGSKKRIVYTYSYEEMHILKYIAYLLYDYDYRSNQRNLITPIIRYLVFNVIPASRYNVILKSHFS